MRQFIQSFEESHIILALNNQVIVMDQHDDEVTCLETLDDSEIQAVALTRALDGAMIYAIARSNKKLHIFRNKVLSVSYTTTKRVSSLCFASVQNSRTVLVLGDLAGDAIAYPIEPNESNDDRETKDPLCRLLLGHTASMLTKVMVHKNEWILTADRDEKIRISHFPETHRIHGYLLGHLAFVSSFDVHNNTCVSCGGDRTIRVWNLITSTEITNTGTTIDDNSNNHGNVDSLNSQPIPTNILWDASGSFIAVIYDQALYVDFFSWDEGTSCLSHGTRMTCQGQPIGLTRFNSSHFLILIRDAPFIQEFQVTVDASSQKLVATEKASSLLQSKVIEMVQKLEIKNIPEAILERDNLGNIKIEKHNETRGPMHSKPWENVSRIEIAKERNRRCKRRKQESMNHGAKD